MLVGLSGWYGTVGHRLSRWPSNDELACPTDQSALEVVLPIRADLCIPLASRTAHQDVPEFAPELYQYPTLPGERKR